MNYESLIEPLLQWYPNHHRDLPWRNTKNPYHIWLSEIMLQQTRVEAVKPYYARFLEALPTISDLADCPEDELMKLWEGLGYYSRVRNLQKAAQVIVTEYGGEMPADFQKILALPGIGPYTAGAISSIAFSLPQVAVDGNVLRILTRATEDSRIIDEDKTKKAITQELQNSVDSLDLPEKSYATLNQAMMELGATICLPNGAPKCEECPWNSLCQGKLHGTYQDFPLRKQKKPRRIEEKTILIIRDGKKVLVQKRPEKGLLAGLYEYPNVEGYISEGEAVEMVRERGLDPLQVTKLPEAKHIFSHVEWHMTGFEVRVASFGDAMEDSLVEIQKIRQEYAIPSAFKAYSELL